MGLSTFKPRQPLSASELIHPALDYIPSTVRRQNKTFYIGVFTIFNAIAQILKTPSIPTPQAVVAVALVFNAEAVQFCLDKGGKVEYVLDAMVDVARGESCLGDGTFEDTFDQEGEGGKLGYRGLERCVNDMEFGGVGLGVGIGEARWGPYVDKEEWEEDVEMDEWMVIRTGGDFGSLGAYFAVFVFVIIKCSL